MSVRLGTAQVNVPALLAVSVGAVGGVLSSDTVTLVVAEQPLLVTVTEYSPPALTVADPVVVF